MPDYAAYLEHVRRCHPDRPVLSASETSSRSTSVPDTPTAPRAAAEPRPLSRVLVRSFLNGLLVLGPVALTVYICVLAFRWVDGWLQLPIPGAGFVATVALVTLLGYARRASWRAGRSGSSTRLLTRLPFVRLLYGALRDVFGAFAGEHKRFTEPVLVEIGAGKRHQGDGIPHAARARRVRTCADHVAVYLPQSYNFAGQTIVVPRDRVTPVQAKPSDVLAFIVSGGISMPDVDVAPAGGTP